MSPAPVDLRHTGSNMFDHLRSYFRPAAEAEHVPAITERTAILCGLLFTTFYVAPFYLSPTLRTSAVTSRDAPHVIRARVRAVGLTCMTCACVAVYILAIYGHKSPVQVLRWTGIWPFNPLDILRVLSLVMVLFTCSLYESLIVDGEWRNWSLQNLKEAVWDNWAGYRNLVIAPATEEFVFRSLAIPLFLLAETSPTRIVFISPLVFGLAHLHHFVGFLQTRTPSNQRLPSRAVFAQGLIVSLFQFAYTSLFGFFAAFVFLRTGNLWAVIVAHSFCNQMGFPRFWGKVGQTVHQAPLPATKVSNPDTTTRAHSEFPDPAVDPDVLDDGARNQPQESSLVWTVVYYILIIIGSYAFYRLLLPLTESQLALAEF